ncbi:hypothetical protein SO694_00067142 [Aureococcus anophagefferens]|uniref:V-SNARE coiled-coil homology domain-containing protein n=1 Tax=Aureococcus anophagefferens TaxID=44056 RepID=A0ABR1FQN5_AURAN
MKRTAAEVVLVHSVQAGTQAAAQALEVGDRIVQLGDLDLLNAKVDKKFWAARSSTPPRVARRARRRRRLPARGPRPWRHGLLVGTALALAAAHAATTTRRAPALDAAALAAAGDLDARDASGATALHVASGRGVRGAVAALLDAGASAAKRAARGRRRPRLRALARRRGGAAPRGPRGGGPRGRARRGGPDAAQRAGDYAGRRRRRRRALGRLQRLVGGLGCWGASLEARDGDGLTAAHALAVRRKHEALDCLLRCARVRRAACASRAPPPGGGAPLRRGATALHCCFAGEAAELLAARGGGDAPGGDDPDRRRRWRRRRRASATDAADLEGLKQGFAERGEKLSRLSDKAEELNNAAEEFERMCTRLNRDAQRGGRWW